MIKLPCAHQDKYAVLSQNIQVTMVNLTILDSDLLAPNYVVYMS